MPAEEKKKRQRRGTPGDLVARSLAKMPLGELGRFAQELAYVDQEVGRFVLERLQKALPPPSTGGHGSGSAPFPGPPKPGARGE